MTTSEAPTAPLTASERLRHAQAALRPERASADPARLTIVLEGPAHLVTRAVTLAPGINVRVVRSGSPPLTRH